ncbi:hypothetical protein J437_LFUL004883 [Ladona fulva]|uniref:Uncharacterized protein n=1 Tax=Ladona fulva TaxID=123851 RepID=A0A8K0JZ31_LADFU|nr:hypothetical protein J437_LFUL004883 [Ladona fulva]
MVNHVLPNVNLDVLEGERTIPPPPDVVQVEGTPSNESVENGNKPAAETSTGLSGVVDELALFVQRDAGRIERIRKRYSLSDTPNAKPATTENSTSPVDPEAEAAADDYGFSKRPSVRGIKPRFGSTSQILQEISSPQVVSSSRSWPYPPTEQQQPNPAQTSNHLPQQPPVQTNPVAAAAAAAARRRQRGLPMVQEEGTRGFAPLEPMGQYCGQAVGRMVTAPVYASSPPSSSYLRESYQYPMETSHHCTAQHYPYYHHPNDSAEQQTVPRRYPPPHQPNVLHHQQHPYPMIPPQLHPPPHYGQPMHPNHPAFRTPHPTTPGQPPLKPPSPVSFPPSNYYSVPPHSSYPPQYYAPQQYQSPRLFPSNGNNPQEPQYYHHYQQVGPYHHQQYQGAGSPRSTNYPTQGMAWVAPTPACKRPEQQERGVPEGASASPGFPTMDHQPTTTASTTTSLPTSTSTGPSASLVTSVSASTLSSSTSTSSSVYYAMNV